MGYCKLDAKSVLKNLKDYDCWEHTNYKLTKAEADVLIDTIENALVQVKFDKKAQSMGFPVNGYLYRPLDMVMTDFFSREYLMNKGIEWQEVEP